VVLGLGQAPGFACSVGIPPPVECLVNVARLCTCALKCLGVEKNLRMTPCWYDKQHASVNVIFSVRPASNVSSEKHAVINFPLFCVSMHALLLLLVHYRAFIHVCVCLFV
jgi:hypothetical protein